MSIKIQNYYYFKSVIFTIVLAICVSTVTAKTGAVGDGGTYKIANVFNDLILTVAEEGIVGLKTGSVVTAPDRHPQRPEQLWTLTWDPLISAIAQEDHQGYRIQSKKDYLNDVTSYYPEGRSYAHVNVWRLKFLGAGKWHLQNVRTRNCLSLKDKGIEVIEEKCNSKLVQQQWTFRSIINAPEEDDETHILATNSRFPYTNERPFVSRPERPVVNRPNRKKN